MLDNENRLQAGNPEEPEVFRPHYLPYYCDPLGLASARPTSLRKAVCFLCSAAVVATGIAELLFIVVLILRFVI